jgi:hypothetical protein
MLAQVYLKPLGLPHNRDLKKKKGKGKRKERASARKGQPQGKGKRKERATARKGQPQGLPLQRLP